MRNDVPEFVRILEPRRRQRLSNLAEGIAVNILLIGVACAAGFEISPLRQERQKMQTVLLAPAAPVHHLTPAPRLRPKPAPLIAHLRISAPRLTVPAVRFERPPELIRQAASKPLVALPAGLVAPKPIRVSTGAFQASLTEQSHVLRGAASQSTAFSSPLAIAGKTTIAPGIQQDSFSTASATGLRSGGDAATTASAEFGSSPASQAPRNYNVVKASAAGFDSPVAGRSSSRNNAAVSPVSFHSVEILAKPRPEYTDEARRLRIEGEVWLEVLFSADGNARIQRVVRSLGHGLDENAIAAARLIRFHPARDGSRPIDQVATIRVQFQLAD